MYSSMWVISHTQPFTSSRELVDEYVILINVCDIQRDYYYVAVRILLLELNHSRYLVFFLK